MATKVIITSAISSSITSHKWRQAVSAIYDALSDAIEPFSDYQQDIDDYEDQGPISHSSNNVTSFSMTVLDVIRNEHWSSMLQQPSGEWWQITVSIDQVRSDRFPRNLAYVAVALRQHIENDDPEGIARRFFERATLTIDHSKDQMHAMIDDMVTKVLLDADLQEL